MACTFASCYPIADSTFLISKVTGVGRGGGQRGCNWDPESELTVRRKNKDTHIQLKARPLQDTGCEGGGYDDKGLGFRVP